ncbi:MAG: PAAR domain-containing protein, partial [Gemmatimonadota bacterium]
MFPAARVTDMHVCPMMTGPVPHVGGPILPPGVPNVLIAGLPAAVVTSMCLCVGPPDTVVHGSTCCLFAGKPAARMTDQCTHGGIIVAGCLTVLIGDTGSGSGSGAKGSGQSSRRSQVNTMRMAHRAGLPFTRRCCDAGGRLASGLESTDPPEPVTFVEIVLVDSQGCPAAGEEYQV